MIEQPGDREALSIAQLYLGVRPPGGDRRDGVAGNRNRIGVVERAHLRRHLQLNRPIVIDERREFQLHPVRSKLNGDGGESARGTLNHREGKLAPGEKRRLLSAERSNRRFGEDLCDLLVLKILQSSIRNSVRNCRKTGSAGRWCVSVAGVVPLAGV